jgi:hypothetical protein
MQKAPEARQKVSATRKRVTGNGHTSASGAKHPASTNQPICLEFRVSFL